MRNFKMITLVLMIALAVIFAIIMFLFRSGDNAIKFFGYYASMVLLIIDLITIVSFLLVTFVFKIDNAQQAIKYTLIAVAGVLVVIAVIFALNPLRWPQEFIRERILKLTPIGTNMEDVIKTIEGKEKWETRYINYEHGYMRPGRPESADIALGRETIVGEKSIRVFIGEYRNIFITSVTVFWGFDENSKLIEIYVWKDTDSL